MAHSLRIIFAGTPEFAALHLAKLIDSHHTLVGVLTQPDRPAGRGNKLTISAVKQLARTHNIPVFQPSTLKSSEAVDLIQSLNADIMVVVAYGQILPSTILQLPRLGCINVHGSLLPRWRGAAPIQRSIWAGDKETGVTIIQMDTGLDTGVMLHKSHCLIEATETSASLYQKLAELGPEALLTSLELLQAPTIVTEKQDDKFATYAHKLTKEEAHINWQLPAIEIERAIRAFNPWPVSYFQVEDQNVKVWKADVLTANTQNLEPGSIIQADKTGIQIATGKGILSLTEVQPAGKKNMLVSDLLNAKKSWFLPGHKLT